MKKQIRALAAIALAAGSLSLGSCSVFVAGGKAVQDGVTYVLTPGHYVHSSEPWGTDMFSDETNASLAAEYQARDRAFHKDMSSVYDSFNKWFFNYDKNDPYVY
jgi:hypothetical protein